MKFFERFTSVRDEEDWKRALRKVAARLRMDVEDVQEIAERELSKGMPWHLLKADRLMLPAERMRVRFPEEKSRKEQEEADKTNYGCFSARKGTVSACNKKGLW